MESALLGFFFFLLVNILLSLRAIRNVVETWKCKEDITKYTDELFLKEYEKYRVEAVRRMK